MDRPRCGSDSVLVGVQKRLFVADPGAFRNQIYQKQAIELTPDPTAPNTEHRAGRQRASPAAATRTNCGIEGRSHIHTVSDLFPSPAI